MVDILRPIGDVADISLASSVIDDDLLGAFSRDLPRELGDGETAFERLPTGHRDGIVEEDLEGDVGPCRDRPAHRQHAGMIVRAVAEILE